MKNKYSIMIGWKVYWHYLNDQLLNYWVKHENTTLEHSFWKNQIEILEYED